jgi:hypothetical protein
MVQCSKSPVVLERTQSAFGNDAPIYNAAGLTMFISIMPPDRGPACTRTSRPSKPSSCWRASWSCVLLTIITGGINDRNDIGLPPAVARQIEAVDPLALEVFKTKMGLRFDAGPAA